MAKVVLDTSVLVGREPVAADLSAAISVVSIAELHFGLLVAPDDDARADRAQRLGLIEARFPAPLPVDDLIAREWGRLQAAVANRGGEPRRRVADLALAATARVHRATLLTHNVKDFTIIEDLVEVRQP
jgi:hypothetical protein